VAHVHDRAPGAAPRAQQVGSVLFEVPVVPSAKERRVEALLEIDDQECGRQPLKGEHAATVEVRAARTKMPMVPIGEADGKVAE
jgi:hypothetical protein